MTYSLTRWKQENGCLQSSIFRQIRWGLFHSPVLATVWFPSLTVHWNPLGSFRNKCYPRLSPSKYRIILRFTLSIGTSISSAGDYYRRLNLRSHWWRVTKTLSRWCFSNFNVWNHPRNFLNVGFDLVDLNRLGPKTLHFHQPPKWCWCCVETRLWLTELNHNDHKVSETATTINWEHTFSGQPDLLNQKLVRTRGAQWWAAVCTLTSPPHDCDVIEVWNHWSEPCYSKSGY